MTTTVLRLGNLPGREHQEDNHDNAQAWHEPFQVQHYASTKLEAIAAYFEEVSA
jgi:hypothetical protein